MKMFNYKLGKQVTVKHPYTKTAFYIYKQMLKDGAPRSILPAGVVQKHGRLYIRGKKNTTRKQKVEILLHQNKYSRMKQNFLVLATEAGNKRRKKQQELRKSLSATNIKFFNTFKTDHGKFRMQEVYLSLAKPTANHTEVLKQLKRYINKKHRILAGRAVFVEFDFVGVSLRYFQKIEHFSRAEFITLMERKIQEWTIDQQPYNFKERYKIQGIRLFVSTPDSGGCAGFPHLYGFESKRLKSLIYCPIASNNNCFIDCLHKIKHHSRRTKNKKLRITWKNVQEMNNTYNAVRTLLGIKLGTTIDVGGDDMLKLLHHYKLGADIYKVKQGRFEKIFGSGGIPLWFHGDHFNVVLNSALLQYKFCNNCGHWIIKDHHCNKHKCKRCNCYVSGSHDCAALKCKKIGFMNKHLITRAVKHTEFIATKNIVYADMEAFPLANGKLVVYAVGYCVDDGDMIVLNGENSVSVFIDAMLALEEKHSLVFYNGGKFDLLPLVNCLDKRKIKHTELYCNNTYLKLTFGNVSTLDLYRFTSASLKNACNSFGCDVTKGEFDHERVKSWDDVRSTQADWVPYLKRDVASMRELYIKFAQYIWQGHSLNLNAFLTIASLGYAIWRKTLKAPVHKLKYEMDRWVRRSIYGGRCQPQKQYYVSPDAGKSFGDITDYLSILDINSQYPAVMKSTHSGFPFKFHYTDGHFYTKDWITGKNDKERARLEQLRATFNQGGWAKICILEVELELQNRDFVSAPLPHKDEFGFTRWNFEPSAFGRQVYTSVDINRAIKYGYTIAKLHKVLVFHREVNVFDEFVDCGYKHKCAAKKGTAKYAVTKLLLNSVFGKMLQRPYLTETKLCKTLAEFLRVRERAKINGMRFLTTGDLLVSYDPFDDTNLDKFVTHPSYLGALILSNSRTLMDFFIDKIDGFRDPKQTYFRTDTDCLLVRGDQLPLFADYIHPTTLGHLDFDIDGKIVKYCEPAPKSYICKYVTRDDEIKDHIRAKGLCAEARTSLTWDHFTHCIGKNAMGETVETKSGTLEVKHGRVKYSGPQLKCIGRQHISARDKELGVENNTIVKEQFVRTLGATKWRRRNLVVGNKNMLSLCRGSTIKISHNINENHDGQKQTQYEGRENQDVL